MKRDAKIDKNIRKAEVQTKKSFAETATFQEKNYLYRENAPKRSKSPKKKLSPIKRKSSTAKSKMSYAQLEQEINQLQLNQENEENMALKLINPISTEDQRRNSFDKISNIGKLDPKKIDLTPNRSSTPNKLQTDENVPLQLKQFQFTKKSLN